MKSEVDCGKSDGIREIGEGEASMAHFESDEWLLALGIRWSAKADDFCVEIEK